MKKNRLILLFSALLLVVTLVVLFASVFVVRSIEVTSAGGELDAATVQKVIDDGGLKIGGSSFGTDKAAAIGGIEKKNPALGVSGFTRKFNKIEIEVYKRTPRFYQGTISQADTYIVLDESLKILGVTNKSGTAGLKEITGHIPNSVAENAAGMFLTGTGYDALMATLTEIYRGEFKDILSNEIFALNISPADIEVTLTDTSRLLIPLNASDAYLAAALGVEYYVKEVRGKTPCTVFNDGTKWTTRGNDE